MAELLGNRLFTALDANGNPISGATLNFYLAGGTTTPADVFTSSDLTTPHSQPISADSAGRFPNIYYSGAVALKLVLKDASGVEVRTIDPFNTVSSTGQISLRAYGAACDGGTNDRTAVIAAIAAVGAGGEIYVPADTYIGTSRIDDTKGIKWTGPGRIFYTIDTANGSRVENHVGLYQPIRGSERLSVFLDKWRRRAACTIRVSGDSKAADLGPDLAVLMSRYPWVTVTTSSNSGKSLTDWVSTYLAADIVAAPDVLVLDWGTNPDANVAATGTKLNAGLTTYRASVTLGGIVLATPSASWDGTNGRDEKRNEDIRSYFHAAADTFNAAVADTYALFPDAYFNKAANVWLDSAGVHPVGPFRNAVAQAVFDTILPPGVRLMHDGYGVANIPSSVGNAARAPALADAPATYFKGVQLHRATLANSWPLDGFVETTYHYDGTVPMQVHWENADASRALRRTYNQGGSAWNKWIAASSVHPQTSALGTDAVTTFVGGWTVARASGGTWPFDGYVVNLLEPTNNVYGMQLGFNYANDGLIYARTYNQATGWGSWRTIGGLNGSATYDPPNLADGAGTTTTVTVTGAALGDFAMASFSLDLQGITVTAWVSAANTVSVRFQNESGGAIDLASGTLRARVMPQ